MADGPMLPGRYYQSQSGSVRIPGLKGFVSRGDAVQIVEVARQVRLEYFLDRGDAAAKAVLRGIADHLVEDMKQVADQWSDTGRMVNSIHAATPDQDHYEDYEEAALRSLENAIEEEIEGSDGNTYVLVAGSWLPYACVMVAGRRQDWINGPVDAMAGSSVVAAEIAFRAAQENGL